MINILKNIAINIYHTQFICGLYPIRTISFIDSNKKLIVNYKNEKLFFDNKLTLIYSMDTIILDKLYLINDWYPSDMQNLNYFNITNNELIISGDVVNLKFIKAGCLNTKMYDYTFDEYEITIHNKTYNIALNIISNKTEYYNKLEILSKESNIRVEDIERILNNIKTNIKFKNVFNELLRYDKIKKLLDE
jgi:hypothetical protein